MTVQAAKEIEEAALEGVAKLKHFWRALWVLIAGAFALGGWVASLEIRQRQAEDHIAKVSDLEIWATEVTATRWSIRDHTLWESANREAQAKMFASLNKRNELQELRLQRLEDEQTRIREQQDKIMMTIEKRLEVTPSDVLRELRKITEGQ